MSRKAATVIGKTQSFLDTLAGGGRIEYDETEDKVDEGMVLGMMVLMAIECPHCGEMIQVEYDPQGGEEGAE